MRLALLEEEIDLDGAVAEPDERVRRLPGDLVEPPEPAAQALRDRDPVGPQRLELPRLRDDDEVDVGVRVGLAAGERSLEQERPHPRVALGPADPGIDDRLLPARAHGACTGSMPLHGRPSRLHARACPPGGAAGGDARVSRDAGVLAAADHGAGRCGAGRGARDGAGAAVGDVVAGRRGGRAGGVGGRAGRPPLGDELRGDGVGRRRAGAGAGERRGPGPRRGHARAGGRRRGDRRAGGDRLQRAVRLGGAEPAVAAAGADPAGVPARALRDRALRSGRVGSSRPTSACSRR